MMRISKILEIAPVRQNTVGPEGRRKVEPSKFQTNFRLRPGGGYNGHPPLDEGKTSQIIGNTTDKPRLDSPQTVKFTF